MRSTPRTWEEWEYYSLRRGPNPKRDEKGTHLTRGRIESRVYSEWNLEKGLVE